MQLKEFKQALYKIKIASERKMTPLHNDVVKKANTLASLYDQLGVTNTIRGIYTTPYANSTIKIQPIIDNKPHSSLGIKSFSKFLKNIWKSFWTNQKEEKI